MGESVVRMWTGSSCHHHSIMIWGVSDSQVGPAPSPNHSRCLSPTLEGKRSVGLPCHSLPVSIDRSLDLHTIVVVGSLSRLIVRQVTFSDPFGFPFPYLT
jgi:hypothetical protein